MKDRNPLSAEILTNIFRTSSKDSKRILNREGTTIEFKESYNHAGMAQYFKTIAAFANNSGGYIIFGVGEKPRRLVGLQGKNLKQFEELKVEDFTNNLLEYFSPEIKWDHVTFEFKGMSFGVIYAEELNNKPCICKKGYDDKNAKYTLKEGDIYYRYGGRSQKIKYTELNEIIEQGRKNEQAKWMNLMTKISKIGIENAGLLDLQTGSVSGNSGTVVIDEPLLKKLNFIKEGQFVEKKGKPTLRLIGDIQEIESGRVILQEKTKKVVKAIELNDIMNAFFDGVDVDEPIECIKVICSFSLSGNFPVYFLIKQAGNDINRVIQLIENTTYRGNAKDMLLARLNGKFVEQQKITNTNTYASETKHKYFQQWINENISVEEQEIKYCLQAILWLSDNEINEHNSYIRKQLKLLYKKYFESSTGTIATEFRKTICRVDEALYS